MTAGRTPMTLRSSWNGFWKAAPSKWRGPPQDPVDGSAGSRIEAGDLVANVLDIAQEIDRFRLQIDRKATAAPLTHPHQNLHWILRAEEWRNLEPDTLLLAEGLGIGMSFAHS